MYRDFSELCKQDSLVRKPGTPELHWPLALYKKKSVLDFRLYNQRWGMKLGIARAERDGTLAETRFRLSPKRTSPFKSVGASVQSNAGSRGVRISLSNAG